MKCVLPSQLITLNDCIFRNQIITVMTNKHTVTKNKMCYHERFIYTYHICYIEAGAIHK